MFSARLMRVANRAAASSLSTSSAAPCSTVPCLAARPRHQRRHSSSKASTPPDNTKPAPTTKGAADSSVQTAESESSPVAVRTPSKSNRARSRGANFKKLADVRQAGKVDGPLDQFAGLPSVPILQNITERDLSLSSFFSLHRPISLTSTVPPPTTIETFHNLFEAHGQQDPWQNGNSAERRPEHVVYTLHTTIDNLEDGAQDDGMRWEVISESSFNSGSVKHLDSPPQLKSLEELVAQFKPFRAPPPPQPFSDQGSASTDKRASQKSSASRARKPKQKIFVTELRVTENTYEDGRKSYEASHTPIVRLPSTHTTTIEVPVSSQHQWQPYLERKRRLPQLYAEAQQARSVHEGGLAIPARQAPSPQRMHRIKMHLISVKRQRKLKMKKHKYKKLMKRTRNLRRRLGRI